MTQMRRPDGTGGPLSADERIDDIQFYVDPRAELLIDDVVLYEVAAKDEKRPFPKRIVFTAWFDTGKQGKEWPGEFEIVNHEKPRTWKAAKSVKGADGEPTLRIEMRGPRKLDAVTELSFKYKLTGAGGMKFQLAAKGKPIDGTVSTMLARRDEWTEATMRFKLTGKEVATEITFLPPAGAELLVDDVLLYTPGE
jgi:hypothetical protein